MRCYAAPVVSVTPAGDPAGMVRKAFGGRWFGPPPGEDCDRDRLTSWAAAVRGRRSAQSRVRLRCGSLTLLKDQERYRGTVMPSRALFYPNWSVEDPKFLFESLLYWDR